MDTPTQEAAHGPHGEVTTGRSGAGSNPSPRTLAFGSPIDQQGAERGTHDADAAAAAAVADAVDDDVVMNEAGAGGAAQGQQEPAAAAAVGAGPAAPAAVPVTAGPAGPATQSDMAREISAAVQGSFTAMSQMLVGVIESTLSGVMGRVMQMQGRMHAPMAAAVMQTPSVLPPFPVVQQNAVRATTTMGTGQTSPTLPSEVAAAGNTAVAVLPGRGAGNAGGSKSGLPRLMIDEHVVELARMDPNELRAYMGRVRTFIVLEHGMGAEGYPARLSFYVKNTKETLKLKLSSWMTAQLHKAAEADPTYASFDHDAFVEDMLAYLTGEVRPVESVARERLLAGSLVQGTHPYERVAKYAERFQTTARVLSKESGPTLCFFYLKGLHRDLQPYCKLDENEEEWCDLGKLIRWSARMEQRWLPERARAAETADPADAAARLQGAKRAKHAEGQSPGSARAAVACGQPRGDAQRRGGQPPAKGASGGQQEKKPKYADIDPRTVKSCNPDIKYTQSLDYYRDKSTPVTMCGAYDIRGKLSDDNKLELALFNMCFLCRTERHSVNTCPKKNSKQGGGQEDA